ncbi:MAG: hypothetical protein ACLSGB_06605 [Dorea sp.]
MNEKLQVYDTKMQKDITDSLDSRDGNDPVQDAPIRHVLNRIDGRLLWNHQHQSNR